MKSFTIALASFAALVSAQGTSEVITGVVNDITAAIGPLGDAIDAFDGSDYDTIVAVNDAADNLIGLVNAGPGTISALTTGLTDLESLALVDTVNNLIVATKATVSKAVDRKSDFVAAEVGGVVLSVFNQISDGTTALGDAIIPLVPTGLQSIGQQLISDILSALQPGLDAFADQQGQPTTIPPPPGGSPTTTSTPSEPTTTSETPSDTTTAEPESTTTSEPAGETTTSEPESTVTSEPTGETTTGEPEPTSTSDAPESTSEAESTVITDPTATPTTVITRTSLVIPTGTDSPPLPTYDPNAAASKAVAVFGAAGMALVAAIAAF